eukprot:SAG31_NODE_23345_length_506_cov_0.879607_1_plen_153_part_10
MPIACWRRQAPCHPASSVRVSSAVRRALAAAPRPHCTGILHLLLAHGHTNSQGLGTSVTHSSLQLGPGPAFPQGWTAVRGTQIHIGPGDAAQIDGSPLSGVEAPQHYCGAAYNGCAWMGSSSGEGFGASNGSRECDGPDLAGGAARWMCSCAQ